MRAPIVPTELEESLRRYRELLASEFGARLRSMRLFGSRARGDADVDSDADVSVVIDGLTEEEQDAGDRPIAVRVASCRVSRPPHLCAPVERCRVRPAARGRKAHRLRHRARRHRPMTEDNRKANARAEAALGDDAVRAAGALVELGLPNDAVSRAYYAAFHYARALLLVAGLEPKTHRGVVSWLLERYEKRGLLEPGAVSILARLQRLHRSPSADLLADTTPHVDRLVSLMTGRRCRRCRCGPIHPRCGRSSLAAIR
jgi:uncharacterized protein (UPF0332 family)